MSICCPSCKAELSDSFIIDAFMQMPIEAPAIQNYEIKSGNAPEDIYAMMGFGEFKFPDFFGIHEPQGETIKKVPIPDGPYVHPCQRGAVEFYSSYGDDTQAGETTHPMVLGFAKEYASETITDADYPKPVDLSSFEWSPKAMAYVEKAPAKIKWCVYCNLRVAQEPTDHCSSCIRKIFDIEKEQP
jgi:hypothetical protein